MTTPAEVMAEATGMASGSKFERARAAATAMSSFLQLSPDDKRDLAVMVAQRAAPDLVPRIQSETGMDLTAEQSKAVLDMIQRMDGDDITELAASLRSPEARTATLGAIGGAAATATGMGDVVTGQGDQPGAGDQDSQTTQSGVAAATSAAAAENPTDVAAAQVATLTSRVADLEADLAAAEARARTVTETRDRAHTGLEQAREQVEELEARLRDSDSEMARLQRDHDARVEELERQVRRATRDAQDSHRRPVATTQSAATTTGLADGFSSPGALASGFGSPGRIDTTAMFESAGHAVTATADFDTATTSPTPDPTTGVAQLAADVAGLSASAALRRVRDVGGQMAGATTSELATLLEAIPDGWARRRALAHLVTHDVAGAKATALLGLLDRISDQVFAASAFLDAGIAWPQIASRLSPSARLRVARRLDA